MYTCPVCQKETKILSTFDAVVNGRLVHELNLCPDCRDDLLEKIPGYVPKVTDVLPPEMTVDLLTSDEIKEAAYITSPEQLMEFLQINQVVGVPIAKFAQPACLKCGLTLKDLIETERLGCPQCYDHFEEEMLEVFAKCQAEFEHKGKRPSKSIPIDEKLKHLRLLLAQAKEFENYEKAKVIFEEIKKLEAQQ